MNTLPEALQHAARTQPATDAYIDGERHFSFADCESASRRLASALSALGLVRGDRIAVLSHNQIEWLQLFYAATRIGVAVVALSPRYRDAEIEYMLADGEARLVFTLGQADGFDFAAMFARMAGRLPALQHIIEIDGARFESMATGAIDASRLAEATAAVRRTTWPW